MQRRRRWARGLGAGGGGGGAAATTPPKVSGGCRRAGPRSAARPMLPAPLPPQQPLKTRALASIYAPRKQKTRKNTKMLDNEHPIKQSLTSFNPLPAIGQTKSEQTKYILFDLNKNRSATAEEKPIKLHELKSLTPLRIPKIPGYKRKSSLETSETKPQQLRRENTYNVIDPIYVTAPLKIQDPLSLRSLTMVLKTEKEVMDNKTQEQVSPRTRFKKAALKVAKLSSLPETGKLLCLRERETLDFCFEEEDSINRIESDESPNEKLNKLSEIFQCLEMKGRYRDKMKKDNSWF